MRITVFVTEEEHAKIKRAAGLIPLSAFLKAAVMDKIDWHPLSLDNLFDRKKVAGKKGNK